MHLIKRIYCRIFQTGLRAALPFLPYRKPEILNSSSEVPDRVLAEGIHSVLIVTDASVHASGLTNKLESALVSKGIAVSVFDETVPNPTTDIIERAAASYREHHCEGLVGFGGGSSIDCAKAVGASIARPSKTFAQMAGILKIRKRIPFLIAVPTTAGTGSETTLAAVITDAKSRHKYAINDFPLIPRVAVLDPDLTKDLPPMLTATTGMDALTHAVEAYIGRSTTKETRQEAITAVQLIFSNIEKCWHNGHDMEARLSMARAAFLAGDAFSQSYVGYVHAVAHSLGGRYNVPHGLANAILLPEVLESYGRYAAPKLHRLANAVGLSDPSESDSAGAEKFILAIRRLNREMDIGTCIPEIREADIPQMAAYADEEANPLYPVPVLMDADELQKFYYKVMEIPASDCDILPLRKKPVPAV